MKSLVLIIPTELRDSANQLGDVLGMGPDNYSVALSADGSEPATHYGLHAWVEQAFQALVESGVYPPELAESGISEDDYNAMMAVLVSSFWPDYVDHFATVCADNGLTIVEPTDGE